MNIEDQVCSLELSKRLKELDVKQESLFCYTTDYDLEFLPSEIRNYDICIAAFTVSELGEMIPWKLRISNYPCQLSLSGKKPYVLEYRSMGHYNTIRTYINSFHDDNISNCFAKMLIYLLVNGLIENDKR